MLRGAGVEDGVDAAIEIFEHMLGSGGADVGEEVGAGCGNGNTGLTNQFEGDRVCGHADANQGTAGGDGVRHCGGTRQQKSERTGPECMGEAVHNGRDVRGEIFEHGIVEDRTRDVNNDGVP